MKFNNLVIALSSCITVVTALDFSDSSWIWTNEAPPSLYPVPTGARAFRRFVPSPQGVLPFYANVIITADDSYTLFINGQQVGSAGGNYNLAQQYCVPLFSPCGTLLAITGVNAVIASGPNRAGLLAAVEIMYSDNSTQIVGTDSRWKALNSTDIPSGYNQSYFDDSAWPNAVEEGTGDNGWWGPVSLPPTTCGSCNP